MFIWFIVTNTGWYSEMDTYTFIRHIYILFININFFFDIYLVFCFYFLIMIINTDEVFLKIKQIKWIT